MSDFYTESFKNSNLPPDKKIPPYSQLFLNLSKDRLAFSIFESNKNTWICLAEYKRNFQVAGSQGFEGLFSFVDNHPVLNQTFNRAVILVDSHNSTLIPVSLFDEDEKDSFARVNFKISDEELIEYNHLANLNAKLVYPLASSLKNGFDQTFPGCIIWNSSGIFIESLLINYKNHPRDKRMFVNVREPYMDIVILDGNKLHYFNIFEWKAEEDFIYYIIFVLEQLKLNPEEIGLGLAGNIERNSTHFELIYKYIRNVHFERLNDQFNFNQVLFNIPPHYYFNLFNASLCELSVES